MRGEFITIENAKKIQNSNSSNKKNDNLLNANVKLVDENSKLRLENDMYRLKMSKARKELIKMQSDKSLSIKHIEIIIEMLDDINAK